MKALRRTSGRNRLEVKWKNNLSFGLNNTNHFKYDYKINSIPFASFVDTSYSSFANTIRSAIDLTPDPFFTFEVQSKSPNKTRYLTLTSKLDSIEKLDAEVRSKMKKIEKDFDYDFLTGKFSKNYYSKENSKKKEEYESLAEQYNKTGLELYKTRQSLSELISFENQRIALIPIVNKLQEVEDGFPDHRLGSSLVSVLRKNIENLPGSLYGSDTKNVVPSESRDDIRNMPKLLEVYQQGAQTIRTYFGRFEIEYDKIKNEFLSNECKLLDTSRKAEINRLIGNFLKAKEAYYDLQSLYTLNPLENEYLEKYLRVENQYADFLFKKFMSLQKVINVDIIYVTPTSSNMKNFDLITLELEKTNKLSNHTEKYSYDIYIKGGLKVDFSAGLFGTFLTNHEYNAVDFLDTNFAPTNKKMIRRIDHGKMNIGFGGMVNITSRTGASWFAPGLSFGLILSTQPSLQFTSGLTLSIGKTERLLLHGGYALGFVKRIDGLPLNENIPSVRIGDAVRTVDKFLAKPFFGLTYNLSKNNVFKASSFSTSSGSSSSGTTPPSNGGEK